MFINFVFYIVGIIIPTIIVLYSLGNIVFVTSEYKGIARIIPKILILSLFKIIASSLLLVILYHLLFIMHKQEQPYLAHIFFFYGSYIILELSIINKLISHSDKLVSHSQALNEFSILFNKDFMNRWTKLGWKSIIGCNYIIFIICLMLLGFSMLYAFNSLYNDFNFYNSFIMIILILNLISINEIIKHIKTI